MDIYEEMKQAGVETGSHESDLYAKVCEASRAIVARYPFKASVTTFTSRVDKQLWYDIPFAYTPFWVRKSAPAKLGELARHLNEQPPIV